jgi:hypothetical protein
MWKQNVHYRVHISPSPEAYDPSSLPHNISLGFMLILTSYLRQSLHIFITYQVCAPCTKHFTLLGLNILIFLVKSNDYGALHYVFFSGLISLLPS